MNKELVRVKVINCQRRPSNSDGYEEREILDVTDVGGKMFKLTRFRHDNEYKLAEGHVYEGRIKKANNPQYSDTFEDVDYIKDGFDGIKFPFWPEPNEKKIDDRQKSILIQSDIRAAASMAETWDMFLEFYPKVKAFREAEETK